MRHVVVMTSTASIGLVAIFLVDAINLLYISLLGQQELAAAIGYAATIMFFSVSICIGFSIATAALVARALGSEDEQRAGELATASLIFMTGAAVLLVLALFPSLRWCLELLGARGETLELALGFMQIVVPSIPLLGLGMCLGALLRAKGDPRRAMWVTLSGGMAALVLDPLFIFGFDMGIYGAAVATVLVRVVLVIVGFWGVYKIHRMMRPVKLSKVFEYLRPFSSIAFPAVATQLATPVGNAYVTSAIASFGDDAVAGWAIIGRILPVAFGVIFALSGAVGPIVSQNYGAKLFPRINSTMRDALLFTLIYCLVVWGLLALGNGLLIDMFGATGDAASLVRIFCIFVAGSFLFNGALFVANAAFNNLGFPIYATVFNWGRATLGVIPFVYVGRSYGAEGVIIAWGLGAIVFGVLAAIISFKVIKTLPERSRMESEAGYHSPPTANSPFTSGKGAGISIGHHDD